MSRRCDASMLSRVSGGLSPAEGSAGTDQSLTPWSPSTESASLHFIRLYSSPSFSSRFRSFNFCFHFLKRWLKGVVSRLWRLVQFTDDLLKKRDPLFLSMPQSDRQWTKLLDVPGSIWFFLAPLWLSGWNQPSEWTVKFHHHLAVNEISY